MGELKLLLSELKTNIHAVTETWLKPEIEMLISIQGFNFEHKARRTLTKGGGVGFFY